MTRICVLIGFLFWVTSLSGQEDKNTSSPSYLNELYFPQKGLPVSNVTQVYQSGDGFIWMASYNGLVRFDGIHYKHFTIADYPELGTNRLISIQPGQNGGFWLTTDQAHLINYENGQFKHYGPFPGTDHQHVVLDGDSLTWIQASYGLMLNRENKWIELHPQGIDDPQSIVAFIRLPNGAVILETSDGSVHTTQYPYTKTESYQKLANYTEGKMLWSDHEGNLWHFNNTVEKLSQGTLISPKGAEIIAEGWSQTSPLCFGAHQLKDGSILMRAETGLYSIKNMEVKHIERSTTLPEISEAERIGGAICKCSDDAIWTYVNNKVFRNGEYQFLAHDNPTSIYCDRENNIWLTLKKKGVQRFREASIRTYVAENGHNNFFGIYKDSHGRMWMGEWYRYLNYLKDNRLKTLNHNVGHDGGAASYLEAFDGTLFIGDRYLNPEDVADDHTDLSAFVKMEGVSENLYAMIQTKDSTIWLGGHSHLFSYTDHQATTIEFPDPYYPIRFIVEGKDGRLWMASNGGGLYCYDPINKTWKQFDKSTGLSGNKTRALYLDNKGYIWIATEETGLDRLHIASGKIQNITTTQGLYQNGLHSIQMDELGRMWMSTNQGVFYVDKRELEACLNGKKEKVESFVYTEQNGMLNRETNGGFQNSSYQDKDGIMWYPTQEGAISINPKNNSYDQSVIEISITEVSSSDTVVVHPKECFTLPQGASNFEIAYTAPSFVAPSRTIYRYKLEGFDKEWQEVNNRCHAVYTNIPVGEYTFVVQAYSVHSSEIKSETRLDIIKASSSFESNWFKVLFVFLVIMILYIVYRLMVRNLKRREVELQRQVALQTQALESAKAITEKQKEELVIRDQQKNIFISHVSDELQTPLSSILGPLYALNKEVNSNSPLKENLNQALNNSKKLKNLVERILELSDLQSGQLAMHFTTQSLNDFIKGILANYEAIAVEKNIEFTSAIPSQNYRVAFDNAQLDKVLRHLLFNAFKFTPAGGHIQVKLFTMDGFVILSVSDSGEGISDEQLQSILERFQQAGKAEVLKGSDIGLSIAHEIIKLHGGKIEVESKVDVGSTFRIRLPLAPKHKK